MYSYCEGSVCDIIIIIIVIIIEFYFYQNRLEHL